MVKRTENTYNITLTETQHRFVEKILDNQASYVNAQITKMMCDGQFLIPREGREREKFQELMLELFRTDDMLRGLRGIFERRESDE